MDIDRNIAMSTKSVGIEISLNKVRICVLSPSGVLIDFAEAPRTSSSSDSVADISHSLETAWQRLVIEPGARVGVAVGAGYSGVGSGPAMNPWLDALENKICQKVCRVGSSSEGISYIPMACIQELKMVFENLGAHLSLVEVAPVAVARMLGNNGTGRMEFNSSVAWKTRVYKGKVLEAISSEILIESEEILVTGTDGLATILSNNSGYGLDESLLTANGLSVSKIGISFGSAIGVHSKSSKSNFVEVLDLRQLEIQQRRSIFAAPSMTTQELQVLPAAERTVAESLASVIAASEIDTSWPASSEVKAVKVTPGIPAETFGLDSNFNEAAFIDLTSDRQATLAPGVPPAQNQLPTFIESLNLPPMPSENTRLDNPVISVAPKPGGLTPDFKKISITDSVSLDEDSIVKVLVWLVIGVMALLLALVLFG